MTLIDDNKFNKEKTKKRLKMMAVNMDSKRFTVRLPTHIHKKLKIKIAEENKSFQEVISDMVMKYLDKSK